VNAVIVAVNNLAMLRRDSFPGRAFSVEDAGERLPASDSVADHWAASSVLGLRLNVIVLCMQYGAPLLAASLLACSSSHISPEVSPTRGAPLERSQLFGDGSYAFRVRHVDALDSGKLTLKGSSATLEMLGRDGPVVAVPTSIDSWRLAMSVTLRGTATWAADELSLTLNGEDVHHPLEMSCHVAEIAVAPADAVLVVAPGSPCHAPSVWSKSTEQIKALQCKSRAGLDSYVRGAGVELVKSGLRSDEGCDVDTALYRRVDEGVVAPISGP
jgi:hypothetical protein